MVIQCNPFVANPPIFEIVGDPSPNPHISRRPCEGRSVIFSSVSYGTFSSVDLCDFDFLSEIRELRMHTNFKLSVLEL